MDNPWLNKNEYPFEANFFFINGHKLHYIDEGIGQTIIFIHGTPSWSFDFRNLIKELKKKYRCVAIDHIGFGLSDKPVLYDYSTQNHCKTLEIFISEKRLSNITLVVHDFGGPIGLDFAMAHPELISKIVVINSWLWSSKSNPDFIRLSKILRSPLLPLLYRYLNFSARFLLPKSFGDKKLPPAILKQYTKPFGNKNQRNGPIGFAKSLLNDQDWFETLWLKKQSIENKPVLFIWGMKDPVIKPEYLEKFRSGFPNHDVLMLDSCGHFPQEEEPEQVATKITKWLDKHKIDD